MKEPIWAKRFPTLLGLLLIVVSIVATSYLASEAQIFNPTAQETLSIEDLRISNQTANSVSIAFRTKEAQVVQLRFGKTLENASLLFDDRDDIGKTARSYKTHHFTASNLEPVVQYVFSILSKGQVLDNNGIGFAAKTAIASDSQIQNSNVEPVEGSIITRSFQEANDALVFVTLEGSANLSTSVSQGKFFISLANVYTSDLTGLYSFRGNEQIFIEAIDGDGFRATVSVPLGEQGSIGTLTLGENRNTISQETPSTSGFQDALSASTQEQNNNPQIILPQEGDFLLDEKPVIQGRGKPNQRIEIVVESDPQKGEVYAGENGKWTYQLDKPLPPGDHKVTVRFFEGDKMSQILQQNFQVLASGNQVVEPATPSPTTTTITGIPNVPTFTPVPTAAIIPTTGAVLPGLLTIGTGIIFAIGGILLLRL